MEIDNLAHHTACRWRLQTPSDKLNEVQTAGGLSRPIGFQASLFYEPRVSSDLYVMVSEKCVIKQNAFGSKLRIPVPISENTLPGKVTRLIGTIT